MEGATRPKRKKPPISARTRPLHPHLNIREIDTMSDGPNLARPLQRVATGFEELYDDNSREANRVTKVTGPDRETPIAS